MIPALKAIEVPQTCIKAPSKEVLEVLLDILEKPLEVLEISW